MPPHAPSRRRGQGRHPAAARAGPSPAASCTERELAADGRADAVEGTEPRRPAPDPGGLGAQAGTELGRGGPVAPSSKARARLAQPQHTQSSHEPPRPPPRLSQPWPLLGAWRLQYTRRHRPHTRRDANKPCTTWSQHRPPQRAQRLHANTHTSAHKQTQTSANKWPHPRSHLCEPWGVATAHMYPSSECCNGAGVRAGKARTRDTGCTHAHGQARTSTLSSQSSHQAPPWPLGVPSHRRGLPPAAALPPHPATSPTQAAPIQAAAKWYARPTTCGSSTTTAMPAS
jgi:hypothetical protein